MKNAMSGRVETAAVAPTLPAMASVVMLNVVIKLNSRSFSHTRGAPTRVIERSKGDGARRWNDTVSVFSVEPHTLMCRIIHLMGVSELVNV